MAANITGYIEFIADNTACTYEKVGRYLELNHETIDTIVNNPKYYGVKEKALKCYMEAYNNSKSDESFVVQMQNALKYARRYDIMRSINASKYGDYVKAIEAVETACKSDKISANINDIAQKKLKLLTDENNEMKNRLVKYEEKIAQLERDFLKCQDENNDLKEIVTNLKLKLAV